MAKAYETPEVGDIVTIIKDDENINKSGIIQSIDGVTISVEFSHTANVFDYTPDEIVIHKELPW